MLNHVVLALPCSAGLSCADRLAQMQSFLGLVFDEFIKDLTFMELPDMTPKQKEKVDGYMSLFSTDEFLKQTQNHGPDATHLWFMASHCPAKDSNGTAFTTATAGG